MLGGVEGKSRYVFQLFKVPGSYTKALSARRYRSNVDLEQHQPTIKATLQDIRTADVIPELRSCQVKLHAVELPDAAGSPGLLG